MSLPDAGQPEEYTEEEMTQLLKQFETDKAALTKNQKAAVARYNVKKGKGETIAFRAPGAAPAPAAPAAAAAPGLSPEMQALADKDPATLTKEERIALAKAKSQAARAAMAAEGGAAPGEAAKPKGPSPEELARQKARGYPHVAKLEARLGKAVKDVAMQTDVPYLIVEARDVPEVLRAARDEFGFTYMENMTAVDYPPDRMELVYNLWNMTEKTYIAVKARIPRADPVAPTVEPIFRMADWQEREMYDMFGIRFEGHPYLKRLLLPDGWEGYPLRKDYDVTREQFIALDERGNDVVSFKEDEGW